MKTLLPTFLFVALTPWLGATEIYHAEVTPAEIASQHDVQPPQTSADGQIVLESVFGIALAGPASESTFSSSSGGIQLVQAAISPTTASATGYPTYPQDALNDALATIEGSGIAPTRTPGAAEYRYGLGQNGSTALWNIQFGGVPDYDPAEQNFFPSQLDAAVDAARTAIRANPFRKGAGSGYSFIFQAAYEATVPYTFSGNEWRAKAERDRIGITPELASPADRMEALSTAAEQFKKAGEALLTLVNHPVESAWLLDPDAVIEGAGPAWADGDSWADLLYESYSEALVRFADARFEFFYTRYLDEYQPPGSGNTAMLQLIQDIEIAAVEIDRLVLPLAALSIRGVLDPEIDVHGPSSRSQLLRRLAEHVQERSLFFSAGVNPKSGGFSHATYGPTYVPFLVPAQLASRPFTFDNFLDFTYGISGDVGVIESGAGEDSLIKAAINAETAAFAAIDQVIRTTEEVETLREDTRWNYEGQLKQLCGERLSDPSDPGSETVPDIIGYYAPPEFRDPLGPRETFGDVGLAWNKIDQAETRLLSAYRALAEIDEEAQIIRDYGDERLLSYDRIARIQLDTGKEISALDYLSGEIRAQAIKEEAEEEAKQAEKKSWFSGVAKWVGRGVAAFISGGASELLNVAWSAVSNVIAGDIDTITDIAGFAAGRMDENNSAKSKAAMHRKIGDIQANAARRQAQIDAQRTEIRAMEGAKITMEQEGQEDARIREAIHKLMIRVERQKLEILLAKQALEYAEMEHANLLARIGNLLEEYRRVSIRQASSTLNRPDVRLVRDFEISEANRRFRVAQEYAYLLAKSAEYRFAGRNGSTFGSEIQTQLLAVLDAQNATQIEAAVEELIRIRGDFFSVAKGTGGLANLREVRYSLRDLVAQSNSEFTTDGRDVYGDENEFGFFPGDLQPFPSSFLDGVSPIEGMEPIVQISDEQFETFLKSRLRPAAPGSSDKILSIAFPTGFEPSFGERANPLREITRTEYGHVIEGAGASYISAGAVGVFINVRITRSINPNQFPRDATLQALGTFHTAHQASGAADLPLGPNAIRTWSPAERDDGGAPVAPVKVLRNADTLQGGWAQRFSSELILANVGFHFHERSPANDRWLLEIPMSGTAVDRFIGGINDIEICMTVRGWSN